MNYILLFFYYLDIYAMLYFIMGLFSNNFTQNLVTSCTALLIYIFLATTKSNLKNPYLKLKGRFAITLATIINIILLVILIKSFY